MRRTIFTALVGWMAIVLLAAAQLPPDTLWTRILGGNSSDVCRSVIQVPDEGFISCGYTYSYGMGGSDMFLIKTDPNGSVQWYRTIGGSSFDEGYDIAQTTDGGYALGGWTYSFGAGLSDAYLVKTDSLGYVQLQRAFGGSGYDDCMSLQQTSDGGYILGGQTSSSGAGWTDMYLVKTNSLGNLQWERIYGGGGIDGCNSVQQTVDGGYILGGWKEVNPSDFQMWLVKTDSQGAMIWDQTFGNGGDGVCNSVKQTYDGGYILGGRDDFFGWGNYDIYVVKTDSNGDFQWDLGWGDDCADICYSILETPDHEFVLGGDWSNGDMIMMKIDSLGVIEWYQCIGDSGISESCHSLDRTTDGGYILGGYKDLPVLGYNVYLVRVEGAPPPWISLTPLNPPIQIPASGGSFQYQACVTNIASNPVLLDIWTMVTLPDGSLFGPVLICENHIFPASACLNRTITQTVPAGAPAGNYTYIGCAGTYELHYILGDDSLAFEKLSGAEASYPEGKWFTSGWDDDETQSSPTLDKHILVNASPNPFNLETKINFSLPEPGRINLRVYDINGRLVETLIDGWRTEGYHEAILDGLNLTSGIYIYQLRTSDCSTFGKIIMMK